MLFLTWEMLSVLSPSAPSHGPVPVLAHHAVRGTSWTCPHAPACPHLSVMSALPRGAAPSSGVVQLLLCSLLRSGDIWCPAPCCQPCHLPAQRGDTLCVTSPLRCGLPAVPGDARTGVVALPMAPWSCRQSAGMREQATR